MIHSFNIGVLLIYDCLQCSEQRFMLILALLVVHVSAYVTVKETSFINSCLHVYLMNLEVFFYHMRNFFLW